MPRKTSWSLLFLDNITERLEMHRSHSQTTIFALLTHKKTLDKQKSPHSRLWRTIYLHFHEEPQWTVFSVPLKLPRLSEINIRQTISLATLAMIKVKVEVGNSTQLLLPDCAPLPSLLSSLLLAQQEADHCPTLFLPTFASQFCFIIYFLCM